MQCRNKPTKKYPGSNVTRTHCRAIALHKYTAVPLSCHALLEQVNPEELTVRIN